MPAPASANSLTLGRPVIDLSLIQDAGTRQCFDQLLKALVGMGWPSGARSGDTTYLNVYALSDGAGGYLLKGGNPPDPMNPIAISVTGDGAITVEEDDTPLAGTFSILNFTGDVAVADAGSGQATITVTGATGTVTEAFKTISVSGQSDVVADSATDTLTLAAGNNIAIVTSAAGDSIEWAVTGINVFSTVAVSGQSNIVAESVSDTLNLAAGSGITITTNATTDTVTIATSITADDIVKVFLATVNDATHVISTDATFAFDGTTALVGTAPSSGTCSNTFSRAFLDNEEFLCFGDSAGNYYGLKASPNIARAAVNQAGGVAFDDSTYPLDGFLAVAGAIPSSGTGTATNVGLQLADNQSFLYILLDDGTWTPVKTYETAIFKVTTGATARTSTTGWGFGVGTILKKVDADSYTTLGALEDVTFYNTTQHTNSINDVIQCKKIDGEWFWDVADCPA